MNNKQGINLFKTVRIQRSTKKDVKYTYIFASLAMLTLSIGGLIGIFIWKGTESQKLSKVEDGNKSIQTEIDSPSYTDMKKKVYELNRKAELITPLVAEDSDIIEIINFARNELPEGLTLDAISMDKNGFLSFAGLAQDFTTIGKMMQSYLDSTNFSEFNIESINRVDDEDRLIEGVGFSITFRYSKINYIDTSY